MNSTAENSQPEMTPPSMVERLRGLWRGKTEEGEKPSQVLVITNPAAGQDQPFLKPVNEIFRGANLYWNVDLTMEMGDGRRLAQEAVAKGVHTVVAFGGDGTVVDVASGLVGKQVPLGILPGGTSNMMSRAFGIPQDIQAAARLIADPDAHRLYPIYIGNAGEHFFQQLVGIGMEAQMVEGADRQAKDRLGFFAYILAGLRALTSPKNARYRIEMDDGQVVEEEGVTCLIAKVGNLGIPSLEKSENTADSDSPLMDIVV
ncbi:MAG TPA: diacylglycerol kinase family protein, partial [Anaerolineaceae bacterium]